MTTYTAEAGVTAAVHTASASATAAVFTAGANASSQPINIVLAKYGDVWHFDEDDDPEPTQA